MEILLITSLGKKKWIVPKGIIEEGMSAKKSAMKEAFEEAGVIGEIEGPVVGIYSYRKWGLECQVKIYPCKVSMLEDKWPEKNERDRRWYSEKKAMEKIKDKDLQEIINRFITDHQKA